MAKKDQFDALQIMNENIKLYVKEKITEAQISGGQVDLSNYVTKTNGNANQITFADGQTFQAKLDAGILKGDKGDQGPQGEKGDTGEQGPQGIQGKGRVRQQCYERLRYIVIYRSFCNGSHALTGMRAFFEHM